MGISLSGDPGDPLSMGDLEEMVYFAGGSMTMEELVLIARKRQLEQNIENLLDEFSRENGVMTQDISVHTMVIRQEGKVTHAHHRTRVKFGQSSKDHESGETNEAANVPDEG